MSNSDTKGTEEFEPGEIVSQIQERLPSIEKTYLDTVAMLETSPLYNATHLQEVEELHHMIEKGQQMFDLLASTVDSDAPFSHEEVGIIASAFNDVLKVPNSIKEYFVSLDEAVAM